MKIFSLNNKNYTCSLMDDKKSMIRIIDFDTDDIYAKY